METAMASAFEADAIGRILIAGDDLSSRRTLKEAFLKMIKRVENCAGKRFGSFPCGVWFF